MSFLRIQNDKIGRLAMLASRAVHHSLGEDRHVHVGVLTRPSRWQECWSLTYLARFSSVTNGVKSDTKISLALEQHLQSLSQEHDSKIALLGSSDATSMSADQLALLNKEIADLSYLMDAKNRLDNVKKEVGLLSEDDYAC